MFEGKLGFELTAVFTSYPTFGNWEFNDQFAEEAFSVYDHPKVMIFRKTADFDPQNLAAFLDSVDISQAIFLTPRQASQYKSGKPTLMLSEENLELQQANGTWSEIFNRQSLLNRQPALAVIAFYGFTLLLGWLVFPFLRITLPGLKDKGYGFSRIIGLLLFAFLAFALGSAGMPVTRGLLWGVLGGMALAGLLCVWLTRQGFARDLRTIWKQLLVEEGVFLLMFAFFLWVRWLNPDLWHPWRGGRSPWISLPERGHQTPCFRLTTLCGEVYQLLLLQAGSGWHANETARVIRQQLTTSLALWYGIFSVGRSAWLEHHQSDHRRGETGSESLDLAFYGRVCGNVDA